MKTKTVKIELSLSDYNDLAAIAEASSWSLQQVVQQCVRCGMPPSLQKVPSAFHEELISLNRLDDMALMHIVEEQQPAASDQDELHRKANFDVLRRTYALSLLRWRGHPVPTPYDSFSI